MNFRYSNRFEKEFKRLDKTIKELFIEKAKLFSEDFRHVSLKTHKLHGAMSSYHSFSVNNKYRVIFRFVDNATIELYSIGNHDIYE